ncbi:MAG: pseudouridine synthase [Aquabacterium sp.]
MTERKKLSLNKATATTEADNDRSRKRPVRGSGTAPRARMTAEQAQQAREERARREQFAPQDRDPRRAPDRRDDRRDDRADGRRDGRQEDGYGARRSEGGRGPGARAGFDRPRSEGPYGDRPRTRSDRAPSDRAPSDRPRSDRPSSPFSEYRNSDRPRTDRGGRPAPSADRFAPDAPRLPSPPKVSSHDDGKVRLSKLMSERGIASRREADEWIEEGWVRVNGEVIEELGTRVFPDVEITIDPLARTQQAQRVTILLNKPIGYVSGQAEDGYEPAWVLVKPENRWSEDKVQLQLTRGHLRNLAPAGRLDIDSTGLLVLTQDGRVAKALIGEDSGVEKEYLVRVQYTAEPEAQDVSRAVPPDAIERLRFGLELDGKQLKPAKVSWQNEHQLRFVLREGRKRQIRRMCELVGLKVVGLKRVRMGRIALGDLPVGQWRFLRADERF